MKREHISNGGDGCVLCDIQFGVDPDDQPCKDLIAFDSEFDLFQDGLAVPPMVVSSFSDGENESLLLPDEACKYLHEVLDGGAHIVGQNLACDILEACNVDSTLIPKFFKAGDENRLHDIGINEGLHDVAHGMLFVDFESGQTFAKSNPETGEMSGRYSLAYMVRRHFGVDISEDKHGDRSWRKRYAYLRGLPMEIWPKEAREYPLRDARFPLEVLKNQYKLGYSNLHDGPAQTRADMGLALIRAHGFRTDLTYVEDLDRRVDAEWERSRTKLVEAGLYRVEKKKGEVTYVKNTKVIQGMVVEAYGEHTPYTEPSTRYPDGQVVTDRDTLVESGVPILVELGQSGKNDKRKTLYVPALWEGVDKPITPNFNVIVDTGRISSDWQQLPQKGGIREAIIARHPWVLSDIADYFTLLCSCDYEGLELRTMSERAIQDPDVGYSLMADYLNAGKDVHTYVAANMMGVNPLTQQPYTYEEVLTLVKAKDPLAVAFRALGKIFNFGKGGGMGAGTMAYQARAKDGVRFGVLAGKETEAECGVEKEPVFAAGKWRRVCSVCIEVSRHLGNKWLEAWTEQGELAQKASKLCRKNKATGEQTKADALIPYSNRVRGQCIYTQWLNTPFQGMGGDGVKLAQWRIQREMYTDRKSPLFRSRLILNVHDELVAELHEDRAHEAGFRMAEIMVKAMNEVTPNVANKVEPAFSRRLFKAASLVKGKDGRARPWWPPDAKQEWTWAPDQERMAMDLAA